MAAVAMVTKVQKMLNSLQTSQIFEVMFLLSHPHLVERDKPKKNIGIGRTNLAAVAMEIKKGGF
jgi:hypothetical protein